MSSAGFVHLHVHSAYSLLKGSIKIAKLGELAKADRQPALALTDTDNMFGALEFSEKMAAAGVQPMVGCAMSIDFGDEARDPRLPGRHAHQSWGISCAQTAIIPTNSVIDASAAASSTNIRNIVRLPTI